MRFRETSNAIFLIVHQGYHTKMMINIHSCPYLRSVSLDCVSPHPLVDGNLLAAQLEPQTPEGRRERVEHRNALLVVSVGGVLGGRDALREKCATVE
jgi:hypothetical protein